ncbi:MAG: amidohydrolase [Bacteroidales bacterium]
MEKADLILTNARIYTVDDNFTVAEAMAVKGGKILATGTAGEITGRYEASQTLDMTGKPLYPGFIDAHCHFYGYGLGLLKRADLVDTKSFDEILDIVRAHHVKFPSAFWIEGRGWDQNDWPVKEFPTKEKLDELFPENPVILTRIDGHAALVNSKAMELAGITADTKVEGGDVIMKNGEPTGVLIDNAIELVTDIIPEPDEEQMAEALLVAQKNCFAVGLTGVHDAGLVKKEIDVIDSLNKSGDLKMRMYVMLTPTDENFENFVHQGIYKTDHLNIRSIKLYADGALGSRGARLLEDYSDDPGNTGLILRTPDSIRDICKTAYEKGFQVCTHAIGDSANRLMLQLYGEALKGNNDRRWRIEHVQIVAPEDFDLFGKYDIVPSSQPTHATSDMYWAGDRIGPERMKGAYAYKQLLEQTGWIPLGTDFPIENINPLYTFYAAVVRKDLKGWPENGFQTENALTREETLRGMTIWAAKAAFEENEKGSLEPGKMADFVVLEKDIMEIPGEELPHVKVLQTFVGGEEVFGR